MSQSERRDAMNEELRERFREGFVAPKTDDADGQRLLAAAERSRSGVSRLTPMVQLLPGAVVVAIALIAFFALRPARPALDKDLIVQRAMAAVATPGSITHVVAVTEFDYGPPAPPVKRTEPTTTQDGRAWHRHGPGPQDLPVLRRLETEHWVETDGSARRSISEGLLANTNGSSWIRMRVELGDRDAVLTKIDSERHSSREGTSTLAVRVDAADELPHLGGADLPNYRSILPSERLRDTSNPRLYHDLLSSTLVAPKGSDGKPYVESHTVVSVLGPGVLDGVPVYRLRILYTERWIGSVSAVETSLVAQVRQSDFMPVRIDGSEWALAEGRPPIRSGPSWVTRYVTVETLQADEAGKVLDVAVPRDAVIRTNARIAPGKVAGAAGYPASWIGTSLLDLRFLGYFRLLRNTDSEYEMMKNPSSASVTADEQRPKIGKDFVVAEYTKDGRPGNLSKQAEPVLKVISLARIEPERWASLANVPSYSGSTSRASMCWTRVSGRKALAIHRGALAVPDPPTSPNVGVTIDYLVIDMGDSTVLLQGANTGYKLLERAATNLVPAR